MRKREWSDPVKVSNLFYNCPIRKSLDKKSNKATIIRILELLKAFTYVYDCNFELFYKGKIIFVDSGSSNTKFMSIKRHGERYFEIDDPLFTLYLFPTDLTKYQACFLQKRYCFCRELKNAIEKQFKEFYDHIPTFIIILKGEADVNMSVDKTEVILKDLKYIEGKIKNDLYSYFSQNKIVQEIENSEKSGIADQVTLLSKFEKTPILGTTNLNDKDEEDTENSHNESNLTVFNQYTHDFFI